MEEDAHSTRGDECFHFPQSHTSGNIIRISLSTFDVKSNQLSITMIGSDIVSIPAAQVYVPLRSVVQ